MPDSEPIRSTIAVDGLPADTYGEMVAAAAKAGLPIAGWLALAIHRQIDWESGVADVPLNLSTATPELIPVPVPSEAVLRHAVAAVGAAPDLLPAHGSPRAPRDQSRQG